MSRISFSTPQSASKKRANLSIEDLDDSSSGSSDDAILTDIKNLQKDVQENTLEKKRLEIKIEGLEHDLTCATKASEIGRNKSINIARRLAALFGEALKEEDLITKVQQLQDRANSARKEVEKLTNELNSLKAASPQQKRANKLLSSSIYDDIEKAKQEDQRICNEIDKVDSAIDKRKSEVQALRDEIEVLQQQFNQAVGGANYTITEIKDRIYKNSEDYVLEQCAQCAKSLGIPFDPRMRVSGFVEELSQRIETLRKKVTPSNESESKFDQLSNEVEEALYELKQVSQQVKTLEEQRDTIKQQSIMESPPIVVDYQPLIEKEKADHDIRTKKLRKTLKQAIETIGYDWVVPKSHKDICAIYIRFIKSLQDELSTLSEKSAQYPQEEPDLTVLQSKVQTVKKQNRAIRHKIKKLNA